MKVKKNRPEKRLVIQVPDVVQKLSTLDLLKRAFSVWLDKVGYKKMPISNPKNGMPNMQRWDNIYTFAIIVDDEVVDIMRVQQKMAIVLQAQPKFVSFDPELVQPQIGWKYDNGFIQPVPELNLDPQVFNLKENDGTKK